MTKLPLFELTDLRLFVAVAEAGSLSKGARDLPLALSAASARIRQLEDRLGLPLFVRRASGLSLSRNGEILLEYARRLQRVADDAQAAMDGLVSKRRENLVVWANTSGSSTLLPSAVARLLAEFPQLDVQLHERASRDVLRAVASGQADLGLVDGDYEPTELVTLSVGRDRLAVLAPTTHPLSRHAMCGFREVAQYPLVGLSEGGGLQVFIEKMARLAGLTLTFRARAQGFPTIARLVAGGAGLAVLPKPVARTYRDGMGLALIALADAWAERELKVCLREWEDVPVYVLALVRLLAG